MSEHGSEPGIQHATGDSGESLSGKKSARRVKTGRSPTVCHMRVNMLTCRVSHLSGAQGQMR